MAIKNSEGLLERLLKEPKESAWLEFKENNADLSMIGRCISACANGAILAGKDRAFLVFGIHDKTKAVVGTSVRLSELRKGNENFHNWISRVVEPRLEIDLCDFEYKGKPVAIIAVHPTYDRPVRFESAEYIRIGENVKALKDFPEHERSLWLATSRHKFESSIALAHQKPELILSELLEPDAFYRLSGEAKPDRQEEVIRRFVAAEFLRDELDGTFSVTNLGAVLLARDVSRFPSISGKSVRVVRYLGADKREARPERERGILDTPSASAA